MYLEVRFKSRAWIDLLRILTVKAEGCKVPGVPVCFCLRGGSSGLQGQWHFQWIYCSAIFRLIIYIIRYFINNYRNWGRISIRCCIYKRHTIPVMCFFSVNPCLFDFRAHEYLWKNWPRYKSPHCIYIMILQNVPISLCFKGLLCEKWVC